MDKSNPYSPPQAINSQPTFQRLDQYTYAVDPHRLTNTLLVLLMVYVVVSLVAMLANLMWHSMLVSAVEGGSLSLELMVKNQGRMVTAGRLQLGVFAVTGVVFLMWVRRANINSWGFRAANMNFSPGWSIGYYFVPFLNLLKPFQAMKEILLVSRDPKSWDTLKGGKLLCWWWILWLIDKVVLRIILMLFPSSIPLKSQVLKMKLTIFSDLLGIVGTLLVFYLIKQVSRNQDKLVQGWLFK